MELFPLELILMIWNWCYYYAKSTLQDYRNMNSGEQICLLLPLSNDLLDDMGGGGEDVMVK